MPGKDEAQQLSFIFDKCGAPSDKDWPEFTRMRFFSQYCNPRPNPSQSKLHHYLKDNQV